jgi:Asp-tRNA(Asn)/Glu-tRNA(Gln) amidotransferase A subunit family amidase
VAVRKLLDAGSVLCGATNVPFQLLDCQAFNEMYGTSNNSWD